MLSTAGGLEVGIVKVGTMSGRGFTPEEIAEQALDQIISIGNNSHPVIQAQAEMGADELATATGYTRPGEFLTSVTPTADGTTAILDFANETWGSSSFTTCGGLIYDTSDSDSACAVLSFGGDQTVSTGDFTIQFPAAASATAIIRIA